MFAAYGPIVRLDSPRRNLLATKNPDDVEAVMNATKNNPQRNSFLSLKAVRVQAADNYFEGKGGLFTELVTIQDIRDRKHTRYT